MGEGVECLKNGVDADAAGVFRGDLRGEGVGEVAADDEDDAAEAGADGVEDGVVEDGLAAGADGVELLEPAVA